jgi:hypothetical protein
MVSRVETAAEASLNRTVRIEYDRKRLAKTVLGHAIVVIVTIDWLVWRIVHPQRTPEPATGLQSVGLVWRLLQPDRAVSWWALASVVLAALVAVLRMLRFVYQLQDGNPAMILSPRGLSLKPRVHGEMAQIPWNAIRGIKRTRLKKSDHLVMQVESLDRYAPHWSLFGHWQALNRRRNTGDDLDFSTPMSPAAFAELETLLQRYLAQYWRPAARAAIAATKQQPRTFLALLRKSSPG